MIKKLDFVLKMFGGAALGVLLFGFFSIWLQMMAEFKELRYLPSVVVISSVYAFVTYWPATVFLIVSGLWVMWIERRYA